MSAAPAFQFYASDFVGGTMAFTAEQTGAYILLLCYQWMNGKLPNDDEALAVLGRCSSAALAVVKTKFVVAADGFGLINQRLEDVRAAQNQYHAKQAENGRKGGLIAKHRSSTAQATLPAPLERRSSSPTPTPTPTPDLLSPVSILLRSLGELYGRDNGGPPSYAEEHAAATVVKRSGWELELVTIAAWFTSQKPEDRKFRPALVRLLEDWQTNLDRAKNNKPVPVKRFGVRGIA